MSLFIVAIPPILYSWLLSQLKVGFGSLKLSTWSNFQTLTENENIYDLSIVWIFIHWRVIIGNNNINNYNNTNNNKTNVWSWKLGMLQIPHKVSNQRELLVGINDQISILYKSLIKCMISNWSQINN